MKSFSVQFSQLWWRTKLFTKREPQVVIARIGSAVFFGLLQLSIWWQVNANTTIDILSMIGGMFILLVNNFMGTFFGTLQVFQLERPVFLREQAN